MQWEDISTAPHNGKPVLVETNEGYLVSAVFWTLDMLREAAPLADFKAGDEYWSHSDQDICCEPIKWLRDFPMPQHIAVNP
ncbi:hypothetical protein [Phaeobacter inhibens]|uniref:hypothetical protein n=1 Tax=Phaeobacter inhibens TaxID=221822 RepID=UPI00076BBC08|nr:hypothetical protein [Phaeobacter inhibens]KXF89771.1 hypothetical protein AT574_14280 [Phaeobacter inhibens]WHP69287.1 hypothetical protein QMZ01_03615 [Phaeobacter inhibens]